MRTITKNLYQYEELNERAQERARDWFRSTDEWDSSDWWESAKAFSKIAPIEITSADYDNAQVGIRWTGDESVAELSGIRAWKWLQNNNWFEWAAKNKTGACTMTGFCGDCGFADPIVEYAESPMQVPDLRQVFYESAQAWVTEAQNDSESSREDSAVADMIIGNEYEFDVEGNAA